MSNWGGANRPVTSNKLGAPRRDEGSDGDIQIRQTNLGAKIYGKIGGTWLDISLAVQGVTRIGTTMSDHLAIKNDGISIIKDSSVVSSFGESVIIGKKASSNARVEISSGALSFISRDSSGSDTTKFSVSADGATSYSGSLTITATGAPIAAADSIIFLDADDGNSTKQESLADLATFLASGDGLTASSSVMSVDLVSNGGLKIESGELSVDLGASSIDGTLAVASGGTGATALTNLITLTTHTTGNYVATITGGTGVDSTAATSGEGTTHTLSVDLNELGTETTIAQADFVAMVDATDDGSQKITFSNLEDEIFGNIGGDATVAAGGTLTIANTAVQDAMIHNDVATGLAGAGMTASSGVMNVIAGTGIDVGADAVAVDVSDFLSNGTNNRIVTATGTDAMNAESGLTFDGTILTVVDDGTMQSSSFASGFTGHGWRISDSSGTAQGAAASGYSSATFDNLSIRGTLSVYEMLIQQIRATNGSLIVSSAAKVTAVANYSSGTDEVGEITFESTVSGSLTCPFVVNDIIMCQRVEVDSFVPGDATYNGTDIVVKKVLKVTAVSANVVTTGDAGFTSGTAPAVGDEFVRIGNTGTSDANVARQGILYLTSDDEDAPFIDVKSAVNSYSDWNAAVSTKVRIGKLKGITSVEEEYGLWAGVSGTNYLKATSVGLEVHSTAALYTAYTGSAINFHDTSANPKMTIAAGSIKIFKDDSTTVAAQWVDDVITLGDQTNTKIVITGSGVSAGVTIGSKITLASTGVVTVADIILGGRISNDHSSGTTNKNVVIGSNNATDVADVDASALFASNVIIGAGACEDVNVSSTYTFLSNVAIGNNAMKDCDPTASSAVAGSNVAIGHSAMMNLDVGSNNVAIGKGAMLGGGSCTGSGNIAIGEGSLDVVTSGEDNICIGKDAGNNITTGHDNVVIGAADVYATVSDQLQISSGDGGVTWLYGTINGLVSIKVADEGWIGISDSTERIVFDTDGDINVLGATLKTGAITSTGAIACTTITTGSGATELPGGTVSAYATSTQMNQATSTSSNVTFAHVTYSSLSGGTLHVIDTSAPSYPSASVIIEGREDGGVSNLALRAKDEDDPTGAVQTNGGTSIDFQGFDGNSWERMGMISVFADLQNVGEGDSPGRMGFWTTPNNTEVPTEKMTIKATGYVGIGTAIAGVTEITPLHVANAGQVELVALTTANTELWIGEDADLDNYIRFRPNTGLGIIFTNDGDTVALKILESNGNIYMPAYGNGTASFSGGTGLLATSSDERLKENIVPFTDGLSAINNLNPVYYTWKEKEPSGADNGLYNEDAPNNGRNLGFIAQQVETVIPEASPDWGKDDEQWRGIEDRAIIAALTKAVQELSSNMDAMQTEINNLKGV